MQWRKDIIHGREGRIWSSEYPPSLLNQEQGTAISDWLSKFWQQDVKRLRRMDEYHEREIRYANSFDSLSISEKKENFMAVYDLLRKEFLLQSDEYHEFGNPNEIALKPRLSANLGLYQSNSMAQQEHPAVTRFREYLRINTMQPKPDYKKCVDFLAAQATELGR